jgi:hypothetical protein
MLKNTQEIISRIIRYSVDARAKEIIVEIATGSLSGEEFVSDERSLIKHSITNIPDQPEHDFGGETIPFVSGRAWFDEAAAFISDNNEEYAGLNDYEYNSKRLWTLLLERGLVNGAVI